MIAAIAWGIVSIAMIVGVACACIAVDEREERAERLADLEHWYERTYRDA